MGVVTINAGEEAERYFEGPQNFWGPKKEGLQNITIQLRGA